MNSRRSTSLPYVMITVVFALLALAMAGVMTYNWKYVMKARLHREAHEEATMVAQAQTGALAAALGAPQPDPKAVIDAMEQMLLFTNSVSKSPFFRSVALELDYASVKAPKGTLDYRRGAAACENCFAVSVPLYSADDLLGVANFQASADFFEILASEVRGQLVFAVKITFGLLGVVWMIILAVVERMQREIAERERAQKALEAAQRAAEDASKAKSDFLANMSHEIRTPMNAIVGMTHLARQQEPSGRLAGYLDKIDAASRSLLRIINDILDFSKIEANRLSLERIPFSLERAIENVMSIASVQAKDKNLELALRMDDGVPQVIVGDPLRMEQVLINLTSNAVKFTETGEVVVSVSVAARAAETVDIRISVKDTGPGLPPDKRALVFDAFTQADTTVTRRYGGTGLGLAISRRLVELMGGTLDVTSHENKGCDFHFTVRFGLSESVAERRREGIAGLRGKRVLIVDDNASAREIFREILGKLGLETEAASSGQEAIELLRRGRERVPYDVMLIDWKMPVLDGIGTIKAIQSDFAGLPSPVMVMVTAYDVDELRQVVEDLGVRAVLTKPVTPSAMLDNMMTVLGVSESGLHVRPMAVEAKGDPEAFRGARVLLVEDNAINQQVARELLEGWGCTVEVANNGQEAVDRLRVSGTAERPSFDAVLMDLQMPVMDGIQATRAVRELPGFATLPVIALTARALSDDRERCFRAGMTDYLDKPIDPAAMFRTLSAWLKPAMQRPSTPAGRPLEIITSSLPPPPVLDTEGGLARVNGNEARFRELLGRFVREYGAAAVNVGAAYKEQGPAPARAIVHDLVGVAGNLGLTQVHESALGLQQALREERPAEKVEEKLKRLTAALDQAAEVVRAYMSRAAKQVADAPVHWEPARLATEVRQLAALVEQGNLRAGDAAHALAHALRGTASEADAVRLTERLREYDFDGARRSLDAIRAQVGA